MERPRAAPVFLLKKHCVFGRSLPTETENLCTLVTPNKCLETWFISNKEETEEGGGDAAR